VPENLYLIQVLGNQNYSTVPFRALDEPARIKLSLSSLALAIYYQRKSRREHPPHKINLIFFIPESVIVSYANTIDEFQELYANPQRLIKKYWEDLIQNLQKDMDPELEDSFTELQKSIELKQLPSLGRYAAVQGNRQKIRYEVNFNTPFENIIMEIIFDLFEKKGKFIVDISTGFNLYVQAINEAVRLLLVYDQLCYFLQEKQTLEVQFSIVPPIVGGFKFKEYPITLYNNPAKAFFEVPLKSAEQRGKSLISLKGRNLTNEEKKTIGKTLPKIEGNLINILKKAQIAFNALKYNTPLIFFHDQILSFEGIPKEIHKYLELIKDSRKIVKENEKEIKRDKTIEIQRLKYDITLFKQLLFTLGILQSITTYYQTDLQNQTPTLTFIKEKFEKLYKILNFGQNYRFLLRDLKHIEVHSTNLSPGTKILFKNLQASPIEPASHTTPREPAAFSDNKRNFFAHSGFLSDFLCLSKLPTGVICLHYNLHDSHCLQNITKWLLNPQ